MEQQLTEIKTDRDYAIRKGKILSEFQEQFHERYKYNPLYKDILELLIRDANPYEIIEKLITINDEAYRKINEIMPWVSPNYHLHKKNSQQ